MALFGALRRGQMGQGCLRGRYTRLAMSPLLLPFRLILLMFAGRVNRHQLDVIEYLQEEKRVLRERLGGRRLRFTDAERRRLAKEVGPEASAMGYALQLVAQIRISPEFSHVH
jgi:hypothetical protein